MSAKALTLEVEHPIKLFWSKQGLEAIVRGRGTLITAYSFSKCGNYQSNLDGKLLRISPGLRSVCRQHESLIFVQLYADTPHVYPLCRFHPVSAGIFLIDVYLENINLILAFIINIISQPIELLNISSAFIV